MTADDAMMTSQEEMLVVDAGLDFNSPFPPFLCSHRNVDVIISYDLSARDNDDVPPFKVCKLSELHDPYVEASPVR